MLYHLLYMYMIAHLRGLGIVTYMHEPAVYLAPTLS